MSQTVKGVAPGFLLMPAREYGWQLDSKIKIELPNEGSVNELVANLESAEGLQFPGDDKFCLFGDNVLLLWEVVRVLFVSKKYPDLADDQCLNVVALEVKDDKIILYGEIIRSI